MSESPHSRRLSERSPSLTDTDDLSSGTATDEGGYSMEDSNPLADMALAGVPITAVNLPSDEPLEDIKFEDRDGVPLIMHASLDKLFEQLSQAVTNSQFGDVFTVVHGYFIESAELVRELLRRFFYSSVSTDSKLSEADLKRAQVQHKVMIVRIGNFLRKWISYNAYRIRVDPTLINSLREQFSELSNATDSEQKKWGGILLSQLGKCITVEAGEMPKLIASSGPADSTHLALLLDAEPRVLAEQMTMYENNFFKHITPGDFLHKAFEKSAKSPCLQETIKVFNRFTNLVTTCMVCSDNIKQRTGVLTRFIETAYELNSMNNFSGTIAILSALEGTPISRLKATWRNLPKQTLSQYEEISPLANPEGNYASYRKKVQSTSVPFLPYVGCYMKDLTMIEEIPNMLNDEIVNWNKMHLIGKAILEVIEAQSVPHSFALDPKIQEFLASAPCLSEKEQYSMSKEREPSSASSSTPTMSKRERKKLVAKPRSSALSKEGTLKEKRTDPLKKDKKDKKEKKKRDSDLREHSGPATVKELQVKLELRQAAVKRLEADLAAVQARELSLKHDPWLYYVYTDGNPPEPEDGSRETVPVQKSQLIQHLKDVKEIRAKVAESSSELELVEKRVSEAQTELDTLLELRATLYRGFEMLEEHLKGLETANLLSGSSRQLVSYCVRNAKQTCEDMNQAVSKQS
eukprot:CAMPEP_0174233534 /NCGR_PEP_ID=MMETSP0417-20130205/3546_1 /TAXON_ID=242541 /ORGANISM="Mayorella sp, Strain BSH-02190019" /LENGTH=689 /DNA_ID=CAMNT_0015311761 /DNA_START=53 /DNA_END=2122 /DNA_ORIENTATION=+